VSNQLKSRDWFQYFAQISNVLPKLKALEKNTQMGQQNYSDSSILTVNSNYIKFTDMNQGTDQNGPNEGRKRPTESLKPKRPQWKKKNKTKTAQANIQNGPFSCPKRPIT